MNDFAIYEFLLKLFPHFGDFVKTSLNLGYMLSKMGLNLGNNIFHAAGEDIRDRVSGAVEALSRRNSSRHEHSRNRIPDDIPSSKDVVSLSLLFLLLTF